MSLDELLKDKSSSSSWKQQRKTLLRVLAGISIIALALVAGALLFFSMKHQVENEPEVVLVEDEEQVESLVELMELRKEAELLQKELAKIRKPASGNGKVVVVKKREISRRVPPLPSTPQIISFDPGERGFVAIDPSKRDLYIPTGAVFRARLITPIKTSLDKTFVMAETTNEYRMDMERRIPKGSRLIGRARLNPVLKGVVVEFNTLVLPKGVETNLSGLALSSNALPEIEGLYFSDHLQTYGTALAFGFLSGFADAARVRETTVFGTRYEDSLSDQVLSGLSTASFQVAEEILREIRSEAIEYVVVPAGEPIFVALTRRYDLTQGEM